MPKPWERQEGETDKAFAAFAIYRDMGDDRTIAKAAEKLGLKASRHLETWSSENSWLDRISAWQDHLDSLALRELERDRIKMRRRHAKLGRDLLELAQKKASLALKDPKGVSELTLGVIPQLLSAAANLERLAVGEPTEITERRGVQRGFVLPLSLPADEHAELVAKLEGAGKLPGVHNNEGDESP